VGIQWHEATSELVSPVRLGRKVQLLTDRPQLHGCGVSVLNASPERLEVAFIGLPDLVVRDFTQGSEAPQRDPVAESLDRE
jgi:hypothetical protein